MPRKARSVRKHPASPDPKYGNARYGKFINYLMQRGKKNVAQTIFYMALDEVTAKMQSSAGPNSDQKPEGRQIFDQALKNVSPLVEIKGNKIGVANYQVPIEVIKPRQTRLE